MQKHRGFKKQIEFVQPTGRRRVSGDVLDTAENILNGRIGRTGSENNFVGIVEAKTNDVAVLQYATIDLLSAHVDAAPMPPVFQIPAFTLGDNRCTQARDAAVGKLEMIPGFTTPNAEGRLGQANKPPRAVRGYDFKSSFVDRWQGRHGDHSKPGL